MVNVKKYYGADSNDEVLPWAFYKMIEAVPFNSAKNIEYYVEVSDNE